MAGMSQQWYRLLRGVHYLGYHTRDTMSYSYDDALDFTLVTSNAKEIKEIEGLLQRGGTMDSVIWVIEGVHTGQGTAYYLREVFFPREISQALPEHYSGARKKFEYTLDGKGDGQSFGETIRLNALSWFPAFLEDNGNFGFGLRLLRDQDVKQHFQEMAKVFFKDV